MIAGVLIAWDLMKDATDGGLGEAGSVVAAGESAETTHHDGRIAEPDDHAHGGFAGEAGLPTEQELEPWDDAPTPTRGPASIGSYLRAEIAGYRLADPVDVDFRSDDRRPFVSGIAGLVQIVEPNGAALPEPFFALSDRTRPTTPLDPEKRRMVAELRERLEAEWGEGALSEGSAEPDEFDQEEELLLASHGLLGFAFHPNFPQDPRFFLTIAESGESHLLQFQVFADDTYRVDYDSERHLFHIDPEPLIEVSGHIEFGPDGRLYLGVPSTITSEAADGGSETHNGVDHTGALLAFDVNSKSPKPVVVARGLRNPWRFSFDRATGDLYLPDNGAHRFEELNVIPFAQLASGKVDLGWSDFEGTACRHESCDSDLEERYASPVFQYGRSQGCKLSGGVVYRGRAFPELYGHYFFSDLCSHFIRSLRSVDGDVADYWEWSEWVDSPRDFALISGWALDSEGEIYMALMPGVLLRLVRVNDPMVPQQFLPPPSSPAPHRRVGDMHSEVRE